MSKNILCEYVESSWEANMMMSGLEDGIDKRYSSWTKADVERLKRAIRRVKYKAPNKMVLYRGTTTVSPLLEKISDEEARERFSEGIEIRNLSLLSTSTDRNIAKEFAWKKGNVHVFHISRGTFLVNLKDMDCGDKFKEVLKREKEILIAPHQRFIPYKKYGNNYHWIVKPNIIKN